MKSLFMVGEVAKRLNVSVRTLQYYDKLGLVKPSDESEGGRRLYSGKDIFKLNQILSLKSLGFSLDDIRRKLKPIESMDDVLKSLGQQERQIANKIKSLAEVQGLIRRLKNEIKQIETVDWNKLAVLAAMIQGGRSDSTWFVEHFGEDLLAHAVVHFTPESAKKFEANKEVIEEKIFKLMSNSKDPAGEEAQDVIKEWWGLIMEFLGGNMSLLPEMKKFAEQQDQWKDKKLAERWKSLEKYISECMGHYVAQNKMEAEFEEHYRD